jgi:glycosyltransferase involved in cell wall biosynthesis
MHVLIATDAWKPQINGVVRSLEMMAAQARHFGATVAFLTPDNFRSFPLPFYPEIRIALATAARIRSVLRELDPSHVHIATEGPIGLAARRACIAEKRVFTTSYHTRFPEYLAARAPVPLSLSYGFLRRFHGAARATMVSTASLEQELAKRGFANIVRWTRGVDTELFRCDRRNVLDLPRPVFLYVGRIAVEKSVEAFLNLTLPGTKVVVGDGPHRPELERRFPTAHFLGALTGDALADVYSSSDVFVFPSRTDTFGIVLLEALASGLPIAAYPVTGPKDVIGASGCGVLDSDLQRAAIEALTIPKDRCVAYGARFRWRDSAHQFFETIAAAAASAPEPLKLTRTESVAGADVA